MKKKIVRNGKKEKFIMKNNCKVFVCPKLCIYCYENSWSSEDIICKRCYELQKNGFEFKICSNFPCQVFAVYEEYKPYCKNCYFEIKMGE